MEALQNTTVCFRDPELKSGTVKRDPVLGPKPISGNFASVFSVTSRTGRRYAVKCFTQDVAAQESRYDAISRHLAALDGAALSQPWNVGFEYQPQGVLVTGEWYPMLKMEWAEGSGLIRWIEDHRADPAALASLADRFAALAADLATAGVAHGDLQHGNLLVAQDGTFRLVDYDGMFVPALSGHRATEMGHRNYQSPQRSDADFGPDLDRFSAWVIHFSLVALSTDPSLWGQLHEFGGEFLLLTEDDFQAPAASLRFGTLLSHPDSGLRDLAGRIRDLSTQPLAALPALPSLPPGASPSSAGPHRTRRSAPAVTDPPGSTPPVSTALPPWLTGHLPPPVAGAASGSVSPSTGSGFRRRRRADVVLAAFMTLLLVAPASLTATSLLAASAYPTVQGGALLAMLGAGGVGRRTRSELRAVRVRRRDLRSRSRAVGDPGKALVKLDQEAQALDWRIRDREAKASARMQQLQSEQQTGAARIAITLNQRLSAISSELAALPRREQERREKALAPLQQSHVQDRLRRTPIHETAKLTNLGAKTTDALIAAGIRTAADFTRVRYVSGGGYGTVTALFVLANGHQVKVPSIGEKRARTLESWRQDIENRARQTAPVKLSPAELRSLAAQTAADRTRLQNERKKAEADAQTRHDQLQGRIAAELRAVVDAQSAARADDARVRAQMSQRRAELALLRDDRDRIDAALVREQRTRRGLAYHRYLRFLVTGR
ncbi:MULTISPECIES: hypothetical protein [unclassified Streptomyces]|uniref:hypothetical protein n=1 Tax=unclassified Streptomyces TaxID=2593676 RepID=UPI002E297CA4|nr:hypothetical protein [Streptomyces sp. NBC_00223]